MPKIHFKQTTACMIVIYGQDFKQSLSADDFKSVDLDASGDVTIEYIDKVGTVVLVEDIKLPPTEHEVAEKAAAEKAAAEKAAAEKAAAEKAAAEKAAAEKAAAEKAAAEKAAAEKAAAEKAAAEKAAAEKAAAEPVVIKTPAKPPHKKSQ